jgi:hypothetical protein
MNQNDQENPENLEKKLFVGENLRSIIGKIDKLRDEIRGKPKERIEITNPSKEQLIEELRKGNCTVFFIKRTDGRSRMMHCTLIPEAWDTKYKSKKRTIAGIFAEAQTGKHGKQNLIPVWDLDAGQWRSFYTNSVSRLIRDENTPLI